MHVFGLLTTASSLVEFDEMLTSCTVMFSSPCSSENVEKHFNNIQTLLTTIGESADDDSNIVSEDLEVHSKNFAYLEVMTFANLVRVYGSICVAKFNLQCNMQNVNAICKMAMYFSHTYVQHLVQNENENSII